MANGNFLQTAKSIPDLVTDRAALAVAPESGAAAPESKAPQPIGDDVASSSSPEPSVAAESEAASPSRDIAKRQNYFLRHWRGELSLPVAYWVNGVLALIIPSAAGAAFRVLIQRGELHAGAPIVVALIGLFGLAVGVTVWQCVGVWRSATRYERSGRKFWGGCAKVAVVIGVARASLELANSGLPAIYDHVQIALRDQLPAQATVAGSGRPDAPSRADIERGVLKTPWFASLKRADPGAFEEIVTKAFEGYRRGTPQAEIIVSTRAFLSRIVRRRLLYASDGDVLKSLDLLIGYMDGLRAADPESCVAIEDPSRGAQLKSDLAELFPALAEREMSLTQSIIESGSGPRSAIPSAAQIEPYLVKVWGALSKRSDLRRELMDRSTLTPDEFRPFCEIALAFYQEVRRLPAGEAAAIMRSISSNGAN